MEQSRSNVIWGCAAEKAARRKANSLESRISAWERKLSQGYLKVLQYFVLSRVSRGKA